MAVPTENGGAIILTEGRTASEEAMDKRAVSGGRQSRPGWGKKGSLCIEICCGKGKALIEKEYFCMIMRERFKIYAAIIALLVILIGGVATAQPVPAEDENIPYLMTFGKNGDQSWGDDDFSQTFFFKIPTSYNDPFYPLPIQCV